MEINETIARARRNLARKIRVDSLIVLAVCICLAIYGQDLLYWVGSLLSTRSLLCARYAWLYDWLFGLGGDVVMWQLNNCR